MRSPSARAGLAAGRPGCGEAVPPWLKGGCFNWSHKELPTSSKGASPAAETPSTVAQGRSPCWFRRRSRAACPSPERAACRRCAGAARLPSPRDCAWRGVVCELLHDVADAAGRIHPGMPVAVVPPIGGPDPAYQDPAELRALAAPPPPGHLGARAESTAVNNVRIKRLTLFAELVGDAGHVCPGCCRVVLALARRPGWLCCRARCVPAGWSQPRVALFRLCMRKKSNL